MRAYMESAFYVIYLVFILFVGIYCMIKAKKKPLFLFGLACFILGFGDAFHLVPRAIGLFTKTLDEPSTTLAMWLGIGKLITSVTMTLFYGLLYLFIHSYCQKKNILWLNILTGSLILSRIVLCALPGNRWLSNDSPLSWGIYRNIPFVLLGILVIVLCALWMKEKPFRLLFLAIILSFLFYLPVVLLASKYTWVGMMMLPKTICYMWIGVMGYLASRQKQ